MARLKKRADGRYQRRVTLPDGTKKLVYGKSEPEVNSKVKELEKAAEHGIELGDKTTVGEWAQQWFVSYKSGLRENTIRSINRNYNNHIAPLLSGIALQKVKRIHCQNVMNAISSYSEDLQRKVLNIMKQLFDTAIANGLLSDNPAYFIKITPHSEKINKAKFLTKEQQKQVLHISDKRCRAFLGLCLYAGLRREEALGLLWVDIDEAGIHVKRSLTFPVNQPDDNRELKTKASNRVLPMPDELKAILDDTPKLGMNVITNTTGGEMSLSSFRVMWRKITKFVDFDITPYMLRHSYASTLYRLGVDLKNAQYLMGHTDIKTTLNIYTHIENEDYLPAANKLKNLSLLTEETAAEGSQKTVK